LKLFIGGSNFCRAHQCSLLQCAYTFKSSLCIHYHFHVNQTSHSRQSPPPLQCRRLELRRIRLHGNLPRILQTTRNTKNRNRIRWRNSPNRNHLRRSKHRNNGHKSKIPKNQPTHTLHPHTTPSLPIPQRHTRPIRHNPMQQTKENPTRQTTSQRATSPRTPLQPTHQNSNGNLPRHSRKQHTTLTQSC